MAPKKMNKRTGKQPMVAAEKTRREILISAANIFAEKGFDGASLRIISDNAGTAHGMIRHYFGNKEDLWKAVIDFLIDQFAIRQIPVLEQMEDVDPVQLLKSYVRNFVHMSAKFPELGRIIYNEGSRRGKRLSYIIQYSSSIHRPIDPVFHAVQKMGLLSKYHTHDEFLLFLTTTAMIPMAMSCLTDEFCGGSIRSKDGTRKHANLVISILFAE
jgi:AcrR family transcriptional regulator